jgi:Protein of unknown function (DUF2845)
MTMRATCMCLALLVSCGALRAEEDVIRCKGGLVQRGMIAEEVKAKCGEPKSIDVESVPIRVRRANGSSGIVGTTEIERWTYDRGVGQFPAVLTLEEGKVKTLELITR